MRILFIRHGEPDYEHDIITEKGKKQALAVSKVLERKGIDEIYVSPLGRARMTAEYTEKLLGIKAQVLDFMREIDWAPEICDPEERNKYHPWNFSIEKTKEGQDLLYSDPKKYIEAGPLLKSYDKVSKDLDLFLESKGYKRENSIYRSTRQNDSTIAIFSHGGSSSCAIAHLLNIPILYFCARFPIDFTSVSEIDIIAETGMLAIPQLRVFNAHDHIKNIE